MDTAKVQQARLGSEKMSPASANLWERLRALRWRSLQVKLIAPYLLLTVFLASVGIFITTSLVVDKDRERFRNSLLDASRVANDGIVQQERAQLERLRFLVFADGMAQAMYDGNSEQINNLMRPVLANEKIDIMSAIDENGREIVSFGKDSETSDFHVQHGVNFAGVSSVRRILEGEVDEQGDKFIDIIPLEQGTVLFTSAPVRDQNNRLAGVMMVGSYMKNVLSDIKQQALTDIVLVDLQGETIATTLKGNEEGFQELSTLARGLEPQVNTQRRDTSLNNRPYEVIYSALVIRGQQVGWLGVLKSSDYLVSPAARSRNLLILLFGIGTIAVILMGYLLAQDIARPILGLRSMAQSVASGDLNRKIDLHRKDEIGDLGESFDIMTLHLRERTEEARNLYEETLQRNRELAEINARLEATQLQLIQSEKLAAIGQLTAGIVHDVKNPFAVIMGMAEVLAEDEHMDEATRHGLKVIRESAVKGNTIVSDLLKFARQSRPEMHSMDLRETVQTAMRLTAYLTRRYTIFTDIPDAPLMVNYDSQQIEQVLINMLHNAAQAMPNGGELRVSLKRAGEQAFISIQDNGCGIPPELKQRIFDPFFTTKPEGEGTGLGLSVSYGIIANHHGRIDVESEVGKGTTFTIMLPIGPLPEPAGESS